MGGNRELGSSSITVSCHLWRGPDPHAGREDDMTACMFDDTRLGMPKSCSKIYDPDLEFPSSISLAGSVHRAYRVRERVTSRHTINTRERKGTPGLSIPYFAVGFMHLPQKGCAAYSRDCTTLLDGMRAAILARIFSPSNNGTSSRCSFMALPSTYWRSSAER